jgi:hypothetical protein
MKIALPKQREEQSVAAAALAAHFDGGFSKRTGKRVDDYIQQMTDRSDDEEDDKQQRDANSSRRAVSLVAVAYGIERVKELKEKGGELKCSLQPMAQNANAPPHSCNDKFKINKKKLEICRTCCGI